MAAESYAEFASGFAEFVRGALADGRWVIWVAELDGRLVAQIYVQVVGMVPRPGRFARRWGSLGGRLRRAGGAQQGDRVPRAAERRRLGQARGAGIPRRVAQRARRSVLRARGVRPRPAGPGAPARCLGRVRRGSRYAPGVGAGRSRARSSGRGSPSPRPSCRRRCRGMGSSGRPRSPRCRRVARPGRCRSWTAGGSSATPPTRRSAAGVEPEVLVGGDGMSIRAPRACGYGRLPFPPRAAC